MDSTNLPDSGPALGCLSRGGAYACAAMQGFDFPTLGALLAVAMLVAMLSRRLNLPYSVGLMAAGIGVAVLIPGITPPLTPELIYLIFLPPLVFEAAIQIPWQPFRRELPLLGALVTLGVVIATGVVATGMHYWAGWTWIGALLFGVLIAATDPVSVIAAFKQLVVPKRLQLLVEAESLLNDGAAAVGFAILVMVANGGPADAAAVSTQLVVTVVGGVLAGVAVAVPAVFVSGRTEDSLVEITITMLVAYGSFLLAEHFHASGVLATLTAGMIVGNWAFRGAISEAGTRGVLHHWEYVAFLINSLIFLLIGGREAQMPILAVLEAAAAAVVLSLIGRAAAVYPRDADVRPHHPARALVLQARAVLGRAARCPGAGARPVAPAHGARTQRDHRGRVRGGRLLHLRSGAHHALADTPAGSGGHTGRGRAAADVIANVIMALVAVALAVLTLNPRLLKSEAWRATVTPLASIIGSGFLVAGPILGHAAGHWAFAGMAALCAISYVFGEAIRDNIERVEPLLALPNTPRHITVMERASDLALILAYFVSVAYYLYLFSAFALKGFGVVDTTYARMITAAVIATLGVLGLLGGLRWLEHVELGAVGVKLALIGGLIAGLIWAVGDRAATGTLALLPTVNTTGWDSVSILLGLIILVQGFETSRYLGEAYDPHTRVTTMRRAQLLSFAIYIAFVALITPFLDGRLPAEGGETHIISLLQPVGALVAPIVIAAALMSQLSAAVADMNGASGLVRQSSAGRLSMAVGYVLTAAVAIAITWAADIFQIIVYASKAFVLYYGIQAATAAIVEVLDHRDTRWGRVVLFALATLLAVAVILLGRSAEGH